MKDAATILEVRDLAVDISAGGATVRPVDDVSFTVHANEVLCVVGESGSGKSLSVLAAMDLLPPGAVVAAGQITFQGRDLATLSSNQKREIRGRDLAMVFQNPMTALNPVIRIGDQLAEMVRLHRKDLLRTEVRARVIELLTMVRIPNPHDRYGAYPHELSGGMRQRVMIAMAMAHSPVLLIADEPTTALDVTIQAQVLDLLSEMRAATGSAMILITHDLGVVAQTADRVVVLYAGRVMETGSARDIFLDPRHPYTVGLLASLLEEGSQDRPAYSIPGQPASPTARPSGCVFHPRCGLCRGRAICAEVVPPPVEISSGKTAACHFQSEVPAWLDGEFPHLEAAQGRVSR